MKRMKKRMMLLLALAMLFALTACGGEKPAETPADADPADETGERQTVFDFGAYAVELKGAELMKADDGSDCVVLTLACTNSGPEETGRLSESIQYTATQRCEELTPVSFRDDGTDGLDRVRAGFRLKLDESRGRYDMSEIEIVLRDKPSDRSYAFTIDPSALDGSGIETGGGEVTGGTDISDSAITETAPGSVLTAGSVETEVGGAYPGGLDWMRHWTGNWYGWWLMTNGTGLYAEYNDGTGEGVWDACAYIEGHECLDGTMELWDSDGSWDDPIACIDLTFANPDDTQYGVMCCYGGQFLSDTLERDAWYINPDEFDYENLIDFSGHYEDEDGTFSYRVLLRPWGIVWDDMDEVFYPEQHYYDWYLPLVEAGAAMPETIG